MKDINGSSPPTLKLVRAKTIPYPTRQYEAQLSERDSIFATSYALDTDSPLGSPNQARPIAVPVAYRHDRTKAEQGEGAIGLAGQAAASEQDGAAMAVVPPRSLDSVTLQFGSLPYDRPELFTKTPIKQLPNRSDISTQYHKHQHQHHNQQHSPLPRRMEQPAQPPADRRESQDDIIRDSAKISRPSTPSTPLNLNPKQFDDLQSSAERQSYRSWREGKGKMKGKSIAESQRLAKEADEVERKIDAKMPKPEQGQNVRSRKTSHYLGLFKENEQEVKKAEEKAKDKHPPLGPIKEGRDDGVVDGMFCAFLLRLPCHNYFSCLSFVNLN